jgi:hypothetical protein
MLPGWVDKNAAQIRQSLSSNPPNWFPIRGRAQGLGERDKQAAECQCARREKMFPFYPEPRGCNGAILSAQLCSAFSRVMD